MAEYFINKCEGGIKIRPCRSLGGEMNVLKTEQLSRAQQALVSGECSSTCWTDTCGDPSSTGVGWGTGGLRTPQHFTKSVK